MRTPEGYADKIAKIILRMPQMDDDELASHLYYKHSEVRSAAQAEAAKRWSMTIMPKGE